jgi:hypothetical protein
MDNVHNVQMSERYESYSYYFCLVMRGGNSSLIPCTVLFVVSKIIMQLHQHFDHARFYVLLTNCRKSVVVENLLIPLPMIYNLYIFLDRGLSL